MSRNTIEGICHICGEKKKLTFEHIPPRSTGNNHTVKLFSGERLLKQIGSAIRFSLDDDISDLKYQNMQRGSGFQTLCSDCNSYLGHYYVPQFIDFYSAVRSLVAQKQYSSKYRYIELTADKLQPLAFFKQIISNFCTINPAGTMEKCKNFLLNKANNDFPSNYRLYMSINPNLRAKTVFAGWSTVILKNGRFYCISTISIPPLLFKLVDIKNSTTKQTRWNDITALSTIKWEEQPIIKFTLPLVTKEESAKALSVFL